MYLAWTNKKLILVCINIFAVKRYNFCYGKTAQSVRLGVIKKYKIWNWGCKGIILNFKKACFCKENKPIVIVSIRLGIAFTTKRLVSLNLAIINDVIFPKLRFKELNFWNWETPSLSHLICLCVPNCTPMSL